MDIFLIVYYFCNFYFYKINTYQKNDVLDISDQNKEDDNLIMVGGIAGEEVRKFGQNLKSFSEWKREVNRVLKG